MKTNLKKIGSLLALGLLTISVPAATLFTDNFEGYPISTIPLGITNDTTVWIAHSGTNGVYVVADPTSISAKVLQVSQPLAQDIHANIDTNKAFADITVTNITFTTNIVAGVSTNITATTNFNYAFSSSNSVAALYASFTIYVTTPPTGSGQYFGMFYTTSGGFDDKLFVATNGAASGQFRIAIENGASAVTNTVPVDLTPNTAYTVVTRYVLSSGTSEVWINPINETSVTNAIPLDSAGSGNIQAYAFRQASSASGGTVDIDNLIVGTSFTDVVPGSMNPPTIFTQPNDTNVFSGSGAVFKTLALGDATLNYQWFSVTNNITNSIFGATSNVLTLTSLTTNQTGSIFCVITNAAGTNTTRLAALTVSPSPIPPTIDTNITPFASTNTIGDTVTFSVVAHGLPAPSYQWKFVPATNSLVTNIVSGANAAGTNTAVLTLTGITTNQAGSYFVTLTNIVGTNTSAKAVLTVVPPPFITIAQLRGKVDNTFAPTNTTALFTIQGTVTTWTNMTSSTTSSEFYIQDATAGIAVFWSGAAASTNVPPAGAIVQVTGPLSAFDGLLEIEPVFTNSLQSMIVLSTNNPLPTPQPLPFDPNITGNAATMTALEGSYFVASNVTLTAGATFVANVNEPLTANGVSNVLTASMFNLTFTNLQGETNTLFITASTDIPGKAKPTGPVTIYGVLGYFSTTGGGIPSGFEFTPSRYADIISYNNLTNVLVNARKGDLATNNYTELVVRPGERLTTYVSIGDAAGGSISLVPAGTLPTGAYWTNIVNSPSDGTAATAVFQYTGSALDAGNGFTNQLNVTSTAGTTYTDSFTIYVPTPQEQQIAITEFLANPTTNTATPYFNPMRRSPTDTIGISTNDQYIEVANQSGADLGPGWKLDIGNTSKPVFDSFAGAGTTIPSLTALVVYGGNSSESPGLSTPVAISSGLFLPKTDSGVLVLRNNGYIIDRVVYSSSNLSTNGSLSRFPTINDAFVPQAYISTNLTTAGLQYDGGSWSSSTKVPTGVNGVIITYVNGNAVLNFTANVSQTSTLWDANTATGPYSVIFGQPFPTGTGVFTNVNSATQQFYFITTQ